MDSNKEKLIKIKDSISNNLWLNSWVKEPLIELIDKALDPTPSTVESPFSKEMLKQIKQDYEVRLPRSTERLEVMLVVNHLLTNANEWTKMEQAFEKIKKAYEKDFYTATHFGEIVADIIKPFSSPKPKELKDLKEGEFVWAKKTQRMVNGENVGKKCFSKFKKYTLHSVNHKNDFYEIIDDRQKCHGLDMDYLSNLFQLTPPTPEQITAAEEAAINEVKARFEGLRKGGRNG